MKPKKLFSVFAEARDGEHSGSNRIIFLISIVLALLFLYLALRGMDWIIFVDTIKNAQYIYFPIVLLWSSGSFLIRALRLRVLLGSEKILPISNVFWANMAGYFANGILPARAGELVRAGYISKRNNISLSYALAIGLAERLMDLVALIVLGSFALSASGILSPIFQNALKVISVLGLFGLGIIFILPRFEKNVGNMILILPALKDAQKIKLKYFLQQFLFGLRSLHSLKRAAVFTVFTGFIWFMDAIGSVLLAYILKIPLLLEQALVLLAALGLSSAIPSTPGYVGVYQFVAVTTLAPFGVSKADALAYILISQILGYLMVGFWGLLSLWQFNKNSGV